MNQQLNDAFVSLEEAQDRAARRKALDLANIPIKVPEVHGQFRFLGYAARSRIYKCALCGNTRAECLGVFSREEHSTGGMRYSLAVDWPQGEALRHEVEHVEEPFCFSCIQELGFTVMEDRGEQRYMPQEKYLERGITHPQGTKRIIPKSVGKVMQDFAEKPSSRLDLDVEAMLDELSDGTAKE